MLNGSAVPVFQCFLAVYNVMSVAVLASTTRRFGLWAVASCGQYLRTLRQPGTDRWRNGALLPTGGTGDT